MSQDPVPAATTKKRSSEAGLASPGIAAKSASSKPRRTPPRSVAAAPPAAPAGDPGAPSPAAAAAEASESAQGSGRKGAKPSKARPRLVRDSFTMPEDDFALISMLKSTALERRRAAKKSELLRAGLHALAGLDAEALVASLERLEPVKTGRPKKGH